MKPDRNAIISSPAAGMPVPPPMWTSPPEPEDVNPLVAIHKVMKGRYILAVILALGLGAGLGYAGYKYPVPIYRSTAMVRFRSTMPRILYSNEHNQMLPMFDSFMDAQALLMRSQRVTDMAMQSDEWKALHRGLTPEDAAAFVRSLDISRSQGSEIVQISFNDPNPNAAIIGARAVLEAYTKIYGDSDFGADAQRMQVLEDRRTALTNEIKGYGDRIQLIASEFGTDELEATHTYKVSLLNKIETELRDAELMVTKMDTTTRPAAAPAAMPGTVATAAGNITFAGTQPAATTAPAMPLSAEEIAKHDPVMQVLLQKRHDQEQKIDVMLATTQMKATHPTVMNEKALLKIINNDIAEHAANYVPPTPATAAADGGTVAATPPEDWAGKVERLQALYTRVKAETLDLGRKDLQIKGLRSEQTVARQKLDETKARIEQLNLESTGSGRISVVSSGDRPGLPFSDKRKQFGMLGGLGGGLMGMGIVMLLGLLDRRLRNSHDAGGRSLQNVDMLGVLPRLPETLVDAETAALAAHCVHGVRASLQVSSNGEKRAYAITSPSAGEGKTSLTLALGMSFAATGARTLLIDCDLIGGGLSSRVKGVAQTTLLTTLLMQERLDRDQLKAAIKHAQRTGRGLDDAVIEMGLMTRESVDEAVAKQNGHHLGLMDVVKGGSLLTAVQSMGTHRLSVLTLGGAEPDDVQKLSPKKLGRLIEAAKKNYDVVLVDTGPVLGSLEAVMIGGRVDAVLMVVSRGTNRGLAVRALDRLESTGGKPMGVVFNRADSTDATYSSSSSHGSITSRRSSDAIVTRRPLEGSEKWKRMGPLVSAVALTMQHEPGETL
jgi:Mrp family chromosome partitioning ATPase/uncharacterized protein involved in exopolysaccharide biosynthesis